MILSLILLTLAIVFSFTSTIFFSEYGELVVFTLSVLMFLGSLELISLLANAIEHWLQCHNPTLKEGWAEG